MRERISGHKNKDWVTRNTEPLAGFGAYNQG